MSIKRHGKRGKWYIRYRDENGVERLVPGLTDKTLTKRLEVKLLSEVDAKRKGVWTAPQESGEIAPKLTEYEVYLRTNRAGEKHISGCIAQIDRLLTACRFTSFSQVKPGPVQRFLNELTSDPRLAALSQDFYTREDAAVALGVHIHTISRKVRELDLPATPGYGRARKFPRETVAVLQHHLCRGVAPKTANEYAKNFVAFCKWAGRPLAGVQLLDERADRRHDRRALDVEELSALLSAARSSNATWRGLDGERRALLYLTAMGTGFRVSELAALTGESLNLSGNPPTATVPAAYTKNGERAIQPLPDELVDALRGVAGQLFPGQWVHTAAAMLRGDLEAAGIPYVVPGPDGPLYADFHALRHSYITNVIETTGNLRDAQKLARHSSIRLTVDRYGRHVSLSRLAETVNALPRLIAGDKTAKGIA